VSYYDQCSGTVDSSHTIPQRLSKYSDSTNTIKD